jgi:hypothetical protein
MEAAIPESIAAFRIAVEIVRAKIAMQTVIFVT